MKMEREVTKSYLHKENKLLSILYNHPCSRKSKNCLFYSVATPSMQSCRKLGTQIPKESALSATLHLCTKLNYFSHMDIDRDIDIVRVKLSSEHTVFIKNSLLVILFGYLTDPVQGELFYKQLCNIFFIFFFYHTTSPILYWSYYPHRSRDSSSPVCGIFALYFSFSISHYLLSNIHN